MSLRDSLTTIRVHLPSKKRKLETLEVAENDLDVKTENNDEQAAGGEELNTNDVPWRTAYIHEMIPFLSRDGRTVGDDKAEGSILREEGENETGQQNEKSEKVSNNSNDFYIKRLKMLRKENEDFKKHRKQVFHRYFKLVASYEYGLDAVSKLNDLRSAPDNILKDCTTCNDENSK